MNRAPLGILSDGSVPPEHETNLATLARVLAKEDFAGAPEDAIIVVDGIGEHGSIAAAPLVGAMEPTKLAEYVSFLEPEEARAHLIDQVRQCPAPGRRWIVSLLPTSFCIAVAEGQTLTAGGDA